MFRYYIYFRQPILKWTVPISVLFTIKNSLSSHSCSTKTLHKRYIHRHEQWRKKNYTTLIKQNPWKGISITRSTIEYRLFKWWYLGDDNALVWSKTNLDVRLQKIEGEQPRTSHNRLYLSLTHIKFVIRFINILRTKFCKQCSPINKIYYILNKIIFGSSEPILYDHFKPDFKIQNPFWEGREINKVGHNCLYTYVVDFYLTPVTVKNELSSLYTFILWTFLFALKVKNPTIGTHWI